MKHTATIAELLDQKRLNVLGPGQPNLAMRSKLAAQTPDTLFRDETICDRSMAEVCLAGLWLYHDFIDDAHKICQDIETQGGSYWHALVHRREPDYSNAKYWFRRVGQHEIYAPLCAAAKDLAGKHPGDGAAGFITRQSSWDPFGFVDLCEKVEQGQSNAEMLCRHIQAREWELLFDHCYRAAIQLKPSVQ